MTLAKHSAAVDHAMGLSCWQAPENPRILEGGITNVNLLIHDQGRDYVVRMGADIPEHGIMRFNELAVSRAAHAAGIAPAVHYVEPGVLVLEFIKAISLTEEDVRDPDTLLQVVDLMAKMHRDLAGFARGPILSFWVFHVLRDYNARLLGQGSGYAKILPELMAQAQGLEDCIGPVDLVLAHNDLLPANILRDDSRLWLIDWEYGGFNSPLFDLGGLATNCGLNEAAEQTMLTAYYGTVPDAKLMQRYTAMKCASLLRETMWSMVSETSSGLDFDYAAYTSENLARYRRAYTHYLSTRGAK
ncbi:MAG: phosphotransferase [Proteobacteria bacterium]|nr:phosphotransferase [Pseudomonadota bacterium]